MTEHQTTTTKEPLFAKLKRKTTNAGHTTRLAAYKTKKAAQISALKNKITERKKKFGVEYMDLYTEGGASPQILRSCIETALKDLGLLKQQVEKHQNKIVAKEELTRQKIENSIPPTHDDDDDSSSANSEPDHYVPTSTTTTSNQKKPAVERAPPPPKSPCRKGAAVIRPDKSPAAAEPSPPPKSPYNNKKETTTRTTAPAVNDPKSPYQHTPSSSSSSKSKDAPVKLKPAPKRDDDKPSLRGGGGKGKTSKGGANGAGWKLEEIKFSGSASCSKRGKQELVNSSKPIPRNTPPCTISPTWSIGRPTNTSIR
jgi:hypothetical protein